MILEGTAITIITIVWWTEGVEKVDFLLFILLSLRDGRKDTHNASVVGTKTIKT